MKLLSEFIDFNKIQVITEDVVETSGGPVRHHVKLKGPFLEAETKNRNGRIYPLNLLVKEVARYVEQKIKTKRALGELDHPDSPQINLERVSHIIEDLKMEGNVGVGVACVLETPMGRIAETLIRAGVVLGMSTRGIGTLKDDIVEDGYQLLAIDAVADPSAPNAFVEGVLENKEYIMKGDQIVEVAVQQLKKDVDKKYNNRENSQDALRYMLKFINTIKNKRN